MMKKKNLEIGLVLAPAMMLMLFLSATVTTYLFVVTEEARKANSYSGEVAAKWLARGGAYVAEEIMTSVGNSSTGSPDLPLKRPSGTTYGQSWNIVGSGNYIITITPPRPSELGASPLGNINIDLNITTSSNRTRGFGSSTYKYTNRDIDLTSTANINYGANLYTYKANVPHFKIYITDFFKFLDTGAADSHFDSQIRYYNKYYIDILPPNLNCGNSLGVRVNGFWNIWPDQTSSSGSTITAKNIIVTDYIRYPSQLTVGSRTTSGGSTVNFGPFAFRNPPEEWPAHTDFPSRIISAQASGDISIQTISDFPQNLFRFTKPDTLKWSYDDITFETATKDYQLDLADWKTWSASLQNILRDRSNGVEKSGFGFLTSRAIAYIRALYRARCDTGATFDISSTATSSYDARAIALANAINTKYGSGVAKPRVMVNTFFRDRLQCGVEIDVGQLVKSTGFTTTTNNIYIGPFLRWDPILGADPSFQHGDLVVVLKNASDLTAAVTGGVNDISFFVEGTIFTHGDVNSVAGGPTLTLISCDGHGVLSSNFILRNVYLLLNASGYTETNETSDIPVNDTTVGSGDGYLTAYANREKYVAYNLSIVNPTLANAIYTTYSDIEKPLERPYINQWIEHYLNPNVPVPAPVNERPSFGQYWQYDSYARPYRNPFYKNCYWEEMEGGGYDKGKKVANLPPLPPDSTKIRACIISNRDIMFGYEYWKPNPGLWLQDPWGNPLLPNTPIPFVLMGTKAVIDSLNPGVTSTISSPPYYSEFYGPRISGYLTDGPTTITFDTGGVFSGYPDKRDRYDDSFIANPSPITYYYDLPVGWSEGPQRK